ncbi:MAG: ferredoxin [Hymenobacter sp.]|nr:ferredoxin [Hymenobacter sp.]
MNNQHKNLLDSLNACVAACEWCATSCLQEQDVKMMVSCISLDRDCADICALTARLVARGSQHGMHLLRECVEVCKACADECEKHGTHMQHCQECAEACRRCEQECRTYMAA